MACRQRCADGANPSFAEGITGCSQAQYQSEQLDRVGALEDRRYRGDRTILPRRERKTFAATKQSTPLIVTGCPKAKVLTRAQKLALALKACHKKPKGKKRQACERQARKQYGPPKKAKKSTKKK